MNLQQKPMELWGGVECTINRVRDRYFNQLELSGHQDREGDLERFAELGLRTLRFPLLWENTAPDSLDNIDWAWADARLSKLKALGIRPVVGLIHHGSGPRYTSLVDPEFPEKFARYAGLVARRYPWIDMYTPVNEPLTTARFSALYGHWYPHARDNGIFAAAMLNQCRAVVRAIREIRQINSSALLVQTEDLGRTFSTPRLRYQAQFENERRWLTWDLLEGAVQPGHRLRDFFSWVGTAASQLDFFVQNPCPPDILGINYYVTSERYLDDKIDNYPAELRGHNGIEAYADDAAVRARPLGIAGVKASIVEAWKRYARPIALTEIHLGCSADEQIRWFMEAWGSAESARQCGVDVRAVTAWALLGGFDWDSLVTRRQGHYEAGVFDVSAGAPCPTDLAAMVQSLARKGRFEDPLLNARGWWRRRSRLRIRRDIELAA